ncbi:hypothetical protein HPP92_005691 [Vanilla planifolia]|uniref:Fcf2 pre-rRNA processing C-terminal domain-containing protein n=1 Tax=Vanilla planifolia TaxID=51239 RepID=A0A835RLA9_VANPL|nr:hypothetical protein HPP92_006011 [Vanilla planifolia]KAG0494697.1 hypothetical protein HPP92_005691 [Vanilla planifolia]
MLDSRAAVGVSWAPNVTLPLKRDNGNIRASHGLADISILNVENYLVDGLYVPPRNPRKLNKLLKKSLKETAGKSWFEMPAPVITPEIKKDLEILKLRNVIDPKRHFKRGENSKVLPKYFQERQLRNIVMWEQ